MNILFLSDVYFPRINGVSTSMGTLRAQLVTQGHHVHLVAPDYYAPSEDESWITRIPSRYLPFDPEDRLMKYGVALRRCLDASMPAPDLIHVHTPFVAHYLGLKLAAMYGVPCLETYHTFFEDYMRHYFPVLPHALLRWLARSLSRRQCNAMHAVVAPSLPMLDVLRGYGVSVPAEVIPTGLEEHSFAAGDGYGFRQRYNLPLDRSILLFVGRVAHEKNIGFLLRVVDQVRRTHPEVLFVIAGEGPALDGLRQEVADMGLWDHVVFLGYLDRRTELNDCYRAADIFVFSSLTETQGLVLLEAMAQGTPVVAIAEMGTRSILREGEGALIAPHEVGAFATRVGELLSDPAERARQGRAAVAVAREWAAESMAARMAAFYRTTLAAHKA